MDRPTAPLFVPAATLRKNASLANSHPTRITLKRALFASLCGAALALTACNKPADTPPAGDAAPAPAADTGNSILVGAYGSLTGSEATFGQSSTNGMKLAIGEVNAAGGIKGKTIELKVYDDQGKSQEAGTAVTRLITSDKVVAILGEVASSLSIAGGRVAQQYGVPMVSPGSTNAQVTAIGDMIYRVCFVDSFQGYVMAHYATNTLKLKKVAILYDQTQAYSKGLKDDFAKALKDLGGEVITEQAFSGGDQDFNAQLTTIRDMKPEAVYLPGYYTDVGNIGLQAAKLGLKVPFMGGDGWDSVKLGEIAGTALDGGYYSNHYSNEDTRPEVQKFVKDYTAAYGAAPDAMAALGYDAALVLADALKRTAALDGKSIAAALNATKDFQGVTGKISFDEKRNAVKPAVVLQLKGGKPSFVAQVAPPGTETPPPAATEEAAPAPAPAP